MQKPRRGEHLSQFASTHHGWAEHSRYRKIRRKPTHPQRKRKQDENGKWKTAVHKPNVRKEGILSSWGKAKALESFLWVICRMLSVSLVGASLTVSSLLKGPKMPDASSPSHCRSVKVIYTHDPALIGVRIVVD